MDDELRFTHRAIDHPGSITCPHCAAVVPLPTDNPWLILGGQAMEPTLESFLCPECRGRIYLHPVSEEEQARDAELDALGDEDD